MSRENTAQQVAARVFVAENRWDEELAWYHARELHPYITRDEYLQTVVDRAELFFANNFTS